MYDVKRAQSCIALHMSHIAHTTPDVEGDVYDGQIQMGSFDFVCVCVRVEWASDGLGECATDRIARNDAA